jgi:hypothetical protein
MVFLERCDHNRFNDEWPDHDWQLLAADIPRLASRQSHRDLAKEYIGGLFRWRLLGTPTRRSLFDGTATNSLGEKHSIQWSFGRKITKLDDMESAPSSGIRHLLGANIYEMSDKAKTPTDIYTNHQTKVLVVDATTVTPSQAYQITYSSAQDWSQYEQLTFRVCADADVTDQSTSDGSALPDFTLVFDSLNGSAQITAASLRTANRPRRPVYHKIKSGVNCTAICLETIAVKLARLSGPDLTAITAFAVVIPANTGRQFFDSFELVKR